MEGLPEGRGSLGQTDACGNVLAYTWEGLQIHLEINFRTKLFKVGLALHGPIEKDLTVIWACFVCKRIAPRTFILRHTFYNTSVVALEEITCGGNGSAQCSICKHPWSLIVQTTCVFQSKPPDMGEVDITKDILIHSTQIRAGSLWVAVPAKRTLLEMPEMMR
jgi:hypothetical protein